MHMKSAYSARCSHWRQLKAGTRSYLPEIKSSLCPYASSHIPPAPVTHVQLVSSCTLNRGVFFLLNLLWIELSIIIRSGHTILLAVIVEYPKIHISIAVTSPRHRVMGLRMIPHVGKDDSDWEIFRETILQ